ncbi:MAG: family 10 glycosylhydrolase, partial [Pseudomonadota bacterium]
MKSIFKRYIIYLPIVLVIACVLSTHFFNSFSKDTIADTGRMAAVEKSNELAPLVPGIFILNETEGDYASIGALFSCVGYGVTEGSLEDFKGLKESNIILLLAENEAKKLKAEDNEYIAESIRTGLGVITWGQSLLSESLGLDFPGIKRKIEGYTWSGENDTPILFEAPVELEMFTSGESLKVLAEDMGKNPVMVSGSYGSGNFIYSGIPVASAEGSGYEHFPFLIEAVKGQLGMAPVFARDDLALYVDADYHMHESPAELAEKIKDYGVDQINLSAWYSLEDHGRMYKEIIEECHKRGISVFAWFELPFVSIDFWDRHPEWREKTASGEDAHIDWRRLMAMSDPEALEAIKEYTGDIIMGFDWDGVDIAEIYFESPGAGFEDIGKFTPMNDSFRDSFMERYEVDPIKAFDKYSIYYWKYNKGMKQKLIEYRVELITKLHEEFLQLCEDIRRDKPYLRTSVTVIDSIADKSMREEIGVDADAIAALQDKYDFLLQVEDPFTLWNLGPGRYKVIGEEYRNIISEEKELSIDINVIERLGEVYPTSKQRGVELYQLINNAGRYTDKVILYSMATLEEDDMEFVPYATASDIDVRETGADEYTIRADKRFIWKTATSGK